MKNITQNWTLSGLDKNLGGAEFYLGFKQ